MKAKTTVLILCMMSFFLISCDDNTEMSGGIGDSNYLISLYEVGEKNPYDYNGKQGLFIRLQTTEIFPCCNYSIDYTAEQKEDLLQIHLKSINVPEVCLTATGPAISNIRIPASTKRIEFIANNKTYTVGVDISDEMMELKSLPNDFITSEYTKYYRRPANSFALMCGTTVESKGVAEEFTALLLSESDFEEFKFDFTDKRAFYPWAEKSDGHYANFPTRFFTYKSAADFEKAGQILSGFVEKNRNKMEDVYISLYNWDESYFYSWMMK